MAGQQDTQKRRREAMNVHTEPPEAPRGLVRAVTLAPTLGTGAVHGDLSTYNLGTKRPTWARRVGLLVPERLSCLPDRLQSAHYS